MLLTMTPTNVEVHVNVKSLLKLFGRDKHKLEATVGVSNLCSPPTWDEVSTTQPTAVVRHPALAVHSGDPALLPLGVPREPVERQAGTGRPSVPAAGHHTRVNHSKATEKRGALRYYFSALLTPKMVDDQSVGSGEWGWGRMRRRGRRH